MRTKCEIMNICKQKVGTKCVIASVQEDFLSNKPREQFGRKGKFQSKLQSERNPHDTRKR